MRESDNAALRVLGAKGLPEFYPTSSMLVYVPSDSPAWRMITLRLSIAFTFHADSISLRIWRVTAAIISSYELRVILCS